MMRRLAAIGAAVALVVMGTGSALASHAWGPYHWERAANPVELSIGNNLTGGWSSADHFDVALADWDASSVLDLSELAGASLRNCGAVAGRVEVCNDTYGYRNGGWLGLAQIWVSGDHIVQSVVKLNDTFLYGGGTYDSPAWRQLVICQEIGHAFGLDHQDETFGNANLDTCMDYTDSPASNQHPNQHDYDQLEDIYAHLDGSSGGGGDDGGGGGNCPPRNPHCSGGLGRALPFAAAARANGSLYADQLAGGLIRVTHVLWLPHRS